MNGVKMKIADRQAFLDAAVASPGVPRARFPRSSRGCQAPAPGRVRGCPPRTIRTVWRAAAHRETRPGARSQVTLNVKNSAEEMFR